jgi:hypothetical protein
MPSLAVASRSGVVVLVVVVRTGVAVFCIGERTGVESQHFAESPENNTALWRHLSISPRAGRRGQLGLPK